MKNKILKCGILCGALLWTPPSWASYSVECWFGQKPVSEIPGQFRYQSYADHPGPISGKVLCYQKGDKKRVAKEYEVKDDHVMSERVDIIDETTHERTSGFFKYKPPAIIGIPVGKHQVYNDKGQLIDEDQYDQNGKKQGLQRTWYKDGSLKNEQRQLAWFENGMTQGSVSFVGKNPDGKMKVSSLFCAKKKLFPEHDQLCGFGAKSKVEIYRSWLSKKPDEIQTYEKGVLLSTDGYQDGRLVAQQSGAAVKDQAEKEYHKNGKLKRSAHYKADQKGAAVLDGEEQEFNEEGTKIRFAVYQMGEKQTEDFWYENGEYKERTKRKNDNGQWFVERLTYDDQGRVTTSGNYLDEKPVGIHKTYTNGKLTSEETYADGVKTEVKIFNEKGEMTEHFKVFKDGSRKSLLKQ